MSKTGANEMCDHNFQIQTSNEDYYPDHQGEWGGTFNGHQCCGMCKGALDGRCHGGCGGKCNVMKKRSVSRSVCNKCGKLGAQ